MKYSKFLFFVLFPFLGSAQCESLTILSLTINAFDEGRITIHAQNQGQEIFSYPGFKIYNNATDELISQEEVEFFGISGESWHNADHALQNIVPNDPYDLRIELWTNFYSELACTYTGIFTLLPSDICAQSTFGITVMSNEPLPETLVVSLSNSDGEEVLAFQAEFGKGMAFHYSDVCLAPGCYSAILTTNDAVISNPYQIFITSNAYGTEYSVLHEEFGASIEFTAAAWDDCSANDIAIPTYDHLPWAFPNPFNELLYLPAMASDSYAELLDSTGKLVWRTSESQMETGMLPPGVYYLRLIDAKQANPLRTTKVIRE